MNSLRASRLAISESFKKAQLQAMALLETKRRSALKTKIEAHARLIDLDLLDFVPALTPRIAGAPTERPEHLKEVCEIFERIERGEELRVLLSVPPQFGKTETTLHGLARLLARHPEWPIVYASYSATIAEDKSRSARDYAVRAGVDLRFDANALATWLTPFGGGLRARGVGGPLSGSPAKVLIVDDPHKDRAEADSPLMRQKVHDWFTSTAMSRIHPGASVVVIHTRWHDDDLIGRLSKEVDADGKKVWTVINLPAILPDGRPLWHRRPLSFLEGQRRLNEFDWHSLWMGSPRPRGDSVFRGVHFYDKLPIRFGVGRGLDLAYTKKTRACYSSGITMLAAVDTTGDNPDPDPWYYIVDVRRRQCEVPEFAAELSAAETLWRGGAWHWYSSTTEAGVAQLLREMKIPVNDVLATTDKFSRAQPVATAWNRGRILVPRNMAVLLGDRAGRDDHEREVPWLRALVDELGRFTGVSDVADDQVDSLASAYESVRFYTGRSRGVEEDRRDSRDDYRWGTPDRGFG